MTDFHLELASLFRNAAGDPYQMIRLRRLAESALCRTGFEKDEDLMASLIRAASVGRLGPEGLLDDDHVGGWTPGEIGGEPDVPDEHDDSSAPQQSSPATEPSDIDFDQDQQAETLVNAAKDGTPFCEECEKARQAEAAGA